MEWMRPWQTKHGVWSVVVDFIKVRSVVEKLLKSSRACCKEIFITLNDINAAIAVKNASLTVVEHVIIHKIVCVSCKNSRSCEDHGEN